MVHGFAGTYGLGMGEWLRMIYLGGFPLSASLYSEVLQSLIGFHCFGQPNGHRKIDVYEKLVLRGLIQKCMRKGMSCGPLADMAGLPQTASQCAQ